MKLKLIRNARISHTAGEIVDVSPAEAAFLISVGSAVEVREIVPEEKKTAPKKAAKRNKNEADSKE